MSTAWTLSRYACCSLEPPHCRLRFQAAGAAFDIMVMWPSQSDKEQPKCGRLSKVCPVGWVRAEGAAQVHPIIRLRQVKGTVLSTAGRAISSLPKSLPSHSLPMPPQYQQQVGHDVLNPCQDLKTSWCLSSACWACPEGQASDAQRT